MAYLTFDDNTTKPVSAKEGIRLMLVKKGLKEGSAKLKAYLARVRSIDFDDHQPAAPQYRLPYADD